LTIATWQRTAWGSAGIEANFAGLAAAATSLAAAASLI
jgi:hypothetical protein